VILLGACALLVSVLAQEPVAVEYMLTDLPGPSGAENRAGHWRVVVELRGLDPEAGAAGLVATGWGWPRDWPYLELIESVPPVAVLAADGSSLTLEQPPGWDGSARIVYRVRLTQRGSEEHARMGLVPSRGNGFAYGNSKNVLLQPTLRENERANFLVRTEPGQRDRMMPEIEAGNTWWSTTCHGVAPMA